jgi:hypothetical protein
MDPRYLKGPEATRQTFQAQTSGMKLLFTRVISHTFRCSGGGELPSGIGTATLR